MARAGVAPDSVQDLVVVGSWAYLGRGWQSRAEAFLAAQGARDTALARRFAYEERLMAGGDMP